MCKYIWPTIIVKSKEKYCTRPLIFKALIKLCLFMPDICSCPNTTKFTFSHSLAPQWAIFLLHQHDSCESGRLELPNDHRNTAHHASEKNPTLMYILGTGAAKESEGRDS